MRIDICVVDEKGVEKMRHSENDLILNAVAGSSYSSLHHSLALSRVCILIACLVPL